MTSAWPAPSTTKAPHTIECPIPICCQFDGWRQVLNAPSPTTRIHPLTQPPVHLSLSLSLLSSLLSPRFVYSLLVIGGVCATRDVHICVCVFVGASESMSGTFTRKSDVWYVISERSRGDWLGSYHFFFLLFFLSFFSPFSFFLSLSMYALFCFAIGCSVSPFGSC